MKNKKKNKVIPQMFDVRPVTETGDLDLEKIEKIEKILKLEQKKVEKKTDPSGNVYDIKLPDAIEEEIERFRSLVLEERAKVYQLGRAFKNENVPIMYEVENDRPVKTHARHSIVRNKEQSRYFEKEKGEKSLEEANSPLKNDDYFQQATEDEIFWNLRYLENQKSKLEEEKKKEKQKKERIKRVRFEKKRKRRQEFASRHRKKLIFSFASVALAAFVAVFGFGLVKKGLLIKNSVIGQGQAAYVALAQAKDNMLGQNFQQSATDFSEAYDEFNEMSEEINSLSKVLVNISQYLPFLSKLSTGSSLAQAGKDVSQIGVLSDQIIRQLDRINNPLPNSGSDSNPVSLLKTFQNTEANVKQIDALLKDIQNDLSRVNVDDIPSNQRDTFIMLQNKLPEIETFVDGFVNNSQIFTDILGGDGPRKYLFLFQNNQEMRATGGFIGTYGELDIFNGQVTKFFTDGIYDPDGQMKDKIVPPIPIQKISANWSLHDSNWFPDFPTSAQEAIQFYERDGGPTVDGVITMTPVVIQKLLAITGPISMPDYGVTVDQNNFINLIQQEVQVDYNKTTNKPKQILSDLAPKIMNKLFATKDLSTLSKIADALVESLNEKQILLYSSNYDIEQEISQAGWSGAILNTPKDYLSVINTNINGYKTDGVIDETINHSAAIQPDGSIIDTVTITRHHNGGNTPYDWYNKVNADYVRVYVPQGSQLISAEGQTREVDSPPLDYDALGFTRDPLVQMEEDSTKIDPTTGTRIYDENNKTVFANWTYVSPQETVVLKYKYLLPFKIVMSGTDPADNYSLLAQKQSGSLGDKFTSKLTFPSDYDVIWKYPDTVTQSENSLELDSDLTTDKFWGVAFTKK